MRTLVFFIAFFIACFSFQYNYAQCAISDLFAEAYIDCNEDGTFKVDLEFNIANGNNNGFDVYINDQIYTSFPNYPNPFVTLENVQINPAGTVTIAVKDSDDLSCFAEFSLTPPDCAFLTNCDFNLYEVVAFNCSDVGVYDLNFLVLENEFEGDYFDLYSNGELLYSQEPIPSFDTYPVDYPITNSTQSMDQITICQAGTDCCVSTTVLAPDCDCNMIHEIIIEEIICEGDQVYYQLNLDYTLNESDEFKLYLGNIFPVTPTTYKYADLPIIIGPVEPIVYNNYTTIYAQDEVGSCSASLWQNYEPCTPTNDCTIINALPVNHFCYDDGTFRVNISVSHLNEGHEGYSVFVDGVNFGSYFYSNTFSLVGALPADGSIYQFEIKDNHFPDCSFTFDYTAPDCGNNNDCSINEINIDLGDCNDDGTYNFVLNLDYINASNDFFDLWINNEFVDFFPLDQLPLNLENITPRSNSDYDHIKVCINDNPNCCKEIEFVPPACEVECDITSIEAEAYNCQADGTFSVDLAFTSVGLSEFGVNVIINGQGFFIHNLNEEFYTFDGIPYDAAGSVIIELFDEPDVECAASLTIDMPNCEDVCEISNIHVESLGCNDDGTYNFNLFLDYQNAGNDFFDLWINNEFVDFFPLDQLPLSFENITPRSNSGYDHIKVCINDNPDCCKEIEFLQPDCETECDITSIEAEAYNCQADGTFSVDLAFTSVGLSEFGVNVIINGQGFFIHNLNEEFYTFDGIPYDAAGSVIIELFDEPDVECAASLTIDMPNCEDVCEISNIHVESLGCNDDGTYNFNLFLDYQNPTNDFFDLWINNEYVGFFELDQLPLSIDSITPRPNTSNDIVKVCINDNPDCCKEIEFIQPDCEEECDITSIEASAYNCLDDGTFSVDVAFTSVGLSDVGVNVIINGQGFFIHNLNEDYYTFDGIPYDAAGSVLIELYDEPDVECAASLIIDMPNCEDVANCLGFEILDLDQIFSDANTAEGEIIIDYGDVTGSFQEFTYFDGSTDFGQVYAVDENFINFNSQIGNALWISNATIKFDFSANHSTVTSVRFDYWDGGGEENISVNGSTPIVVNDFSELPTTIAPGITVTNIISSDDGVIEGALLFEGTIDNLQVGGQEFILDNLCYELEEQIEFDVWPGDIDYDNVANHFDVLNLGVAFGQDGPERGDFSNEWNAMPAAPWDKEFKNGINYKHADCNGDGVVNEDDKAAIAMNYDLTHGEVEPYFPLDPTDLDPQIFVDFPIDIDFTPGSTVEIPIRLGTLDIPVDDLYGVAFTVSFTENAFQNNQLEFVYESNWFGESGGEVLFLNRNNPDEQEIEIAISRTNQTDISGEGVIGYIIGIIDDIAGIGTLEMNVQKIKAINHLEEEKALRNPSSSIAFTASTNDPTLLNGLGVFPNPASTHIYVQHENLAIQSLQLYNILGQNIPLNTTNSANKKLDVSHLTSGIYFLQIHFEQGKVIRKVEVFRD